MYSVYLICHHILLGGFGLRIGIDIGSTTVKVVLIDNNDNIIFRSYERHMSKVREKAAEMLEQLRDKLSGEQVQVAVTGSAGLGVSKAAGLEFVQEVFATAGAVERFYPRTDVVIELGGEDAKIIFLTGGLEERMNGSCAGGTGAFIDQMATLLNVTPDELNLLSEKSEKLYSIASRCGVFAKTDIQPLLNQGARKEDIAASIFQAVVNQTISGLAQGREIKGNVLFLGGPLHFLSGLRKRFVETLKLGTEEAIFPDNADVFVAIGAALYAGNTNPLEFDEVMQRIRSASEQKNLTQTLPPLFKSREEYEQFVERHNRHKPPFVDADNYTGDAYLGIDAGSTTTKLVLITPEGGLLYTFYDSNGGNPVGVVLEQLKEIYRRFGGRVTIKGSAATGYGEDLIKNAFNIDLGLVETVAHYKAAAHFNPDVDFIIDIGGQDMKCFKIRNGVIDSILLNEACSSGCGSFIETFAKALGYTIADFAKLGLFAEKPVDLGSRCTVFMNSSVKQAQKEGAGVDDISAGLSISIVKNAIYKVIRASSPSELGRNIVVQGGTFLNDAVLRSFELELGIEVTRPTIAGIMGAYGAALAAKALKKEKSSLLTMEELDKFQHTAKSAKCGLCGNNCQLTVNTFSGGRRYISGNRCERPLGKGEHTGLPNLMKWKYEYLRSLQGGDNLRGRIGIPMVLNMFENLPFWYTFFTKLGFEVVLSPESSRALYAYGQHTIPSDTVCYPAKLVHGHILKLIDMGVDAIFYPCLPYNFNEKKGDNHYNCPVVAYYPELINANVNELKKVRYLIPYFGLHRPRDFAKKAAAYFNENFGIPAGEVKAAARAAFNAYNAYLRMLREKGDQIIQNSRKNGNKIIVLAGRPYHCDPEINHGIDSLITSFGLSVITEDAIAYKQPKFNVKVLNQWTYHSRLYSAAEYIKSQPDMELVQLVSFGCGIDAITTDEVRSILESGNKIYTQLKIDEINNLGAVRIRIRSLLAAVEARESSEADTSTV
ncbi:MAG TPA: 2-hydroxyglutaryl-CoA dehydratase [Clostridiales bacterium]|nr:2-hydroxyglutaryl-CoA dehydratase [Clostridiales bacterium]